METFDLIEISKDRWLKALEPTLADYENAFLDECAKRNPVKLDSRISSIPHLGVK